jgi:hypothetical protein
MHLRRELKRKFTPWSTGHEMVHSSPESAYVPVETTKSSRGFFASFVRCGELRPLRMTMHGESLEK